MNKTTARKLFEDYSRGFDSSTEGRNHLKLARVFNAIIDALPEEPKSWTPEEILEKFKETEAVLRRHGIYPSGEANAAYERTVEPTSAPMAYAIQYGRTREVVLELQQAQRISDWASKAQTHPVEIIPLFGQSAILGPQEPPNVASGEGSVGPEPKDVRQSEPTSAFEYAYALDYAENVKAWRFQKENSEQVFYLGDEDHKWICYSGLRIRRRTDEGFRANPEAREEIRRASSMEKIDSVRKMFQSWEPAPDFDPGYRVPPAATSGATPKTKDEEMTEKLRALGRDFRISDEDARKLRIMKAMEKIALDNEKLDQRARFQFHEGVWEAFGTNWSRPVNHYSELGEPPEEPLWEGNIMVSPQGDAMTYQFGGQPDEDRAKQGWRKIKVKEVRP